MVERWIDRVCSYFLRLRADRIIDLHMSGVMRLRAKQLKVNSFRSLWGYCCLRLVHFHTFIFHFNSCLAELNSDEVGNRKF